MTKTHHVKLSYYQTKNIMYLNNLKINSET